MTLTPPSTRFAKALSIVYLGLHLAVAGIALASLSACGPATKTAVKEEDEDEGQEGARGGKNNGNGSESQPTPKK